MKTPCKIATGVIIVGIALAVFFYKEETHSPFLKVSKEQIARQEMGKMYTYKERNGVLEVASIVDVDSLPKANDSDKKYRTYMTVGSGPKRLISAVSELPSVTNCEPPFILVKLAQSPDPAIASLAKMEMARYMLPSTASISMTPASTSVKSLERGIR